MVTVASVQKWIINQEWKQGTQVGDYCHNLKRNDKPITKHNEIRANMQVKTGITVKAEKIFINLQAIPT